jgi:hypothetical protein
VNSVRVEAHIIRVAMLGGRGPPHTPTSSSGGCRTRPTPRRRRRWRWPTPRDLALRRTGSAPGHAMAEVTIAEPALSWTADDVSRAAAALLSYMDDRRRAIAVSTR